MYLKFIDCDGCVNKYTLDHGMHVTCANQNEDGCKILVQYDLFTMAKAFSDMLRTFDINFTNLPVNLG